jgi:hypothetical protein
LERSKEIEIRTRRSTTFADSNSNVANTDDNANNNFNVQNDIDSEVDPDNQEKLRPHPGSESPSSHLTKIR